MRIIFRNTRKQKLCQRVISHVNFTDKYHFGYFQWFVRYLVREGWNICAYLYCKESQREGTTHDCKFKYECEEKKCRGKIKYYKKCKGCKLVSYCCRNHQKKDWKLIHSQQCLKKRKR